MAAPPRSTTPSSRKTLRTQPTPSARKAQGAVVRRLAKDVAIEDRAAVKRAAVRLSGTAAGTSKATKAISRVITKATRKPLRAKWPPAPERVRAILDGLEKLYPEVRCELDHANAWQLIIATILSAQCTDERVNQTTPKLFETFPTPAAMAEAPPEVLEELIRSTGFFRQKAKSIKATSAALVEQFGGDVPRTMDELLTLRGVARKTANVVLGTAYGIAAGVVVDTHVQRLALRLAITRETDPKAIEEELMTVIPKDHWIRFSHQIIWHGRRVCSARKPDCEHCLLAPHCPSAFRES